MSTQQAHSYVNGTSALKIRHDCQERYQTGSKVIRVDFGTREERAACVVRSRDGQASMLKASTPRRGDLSSKRSVRAQSDLSIVMDASGLKEMKEELEHGSAAGFSTRKGSFALTATCSVCLFVFCMFVLVL